MMLNWNFLGRGGMKDKKSSVGGKYVYFLELHINNWVERDSVEEP